IAHAGRGSAATVAQVCGSRGVPRVNTWSKVRAEASRWVNGAPRSQALRSVAISEVCRYSSLYTEPGSTHGDTTTAGAREAGRANVEPDHPARGGGCGGGAG